MIPYRLIRRQLWVPNVLGLWRYWIRSVSGPLFGLVSLRALCSIDVGPRSQGGRAGDGARTLVCRFGKEGRDEARPQRPGCLTKRRMPAMFSGQHVVSISQA